MSITQPPDPAKLVVGLLVKEKDLINRVAKPLTERFGTIDMVSPWLPFEFTDYYASEMGRPLFRRLLAFKQLIEQEELADIKTFTNSLEQRHTRDEKRRMNIDPGYLVLERFVLATGKNFSHRIYIGKGIYADLTLIYQKKAFQSLPWTYPDYADGDVQTFLRRVRKKYRLDVKLGHTLLSNEENSNDSQHDCICGM